MEKADRSAEGLRAQIAKAEHELNQLRAQLAEVEGQTVPPEPERSQDAPQPPAWKWPLKADEYERYGRQLILPSVGVKGQLRLKTASVLIVGAGGLGCPAAAYLAGAGVGTIGLVDGDTVEVSNLHRQIGHSTARVGEMKVDSLHAYLKGLNPTITYTLHRTHLTPQNAAAIIAAHDVVLDCTDHPTSRYLISDACVLLRKPLVSASALRTDGQLTTLNHPASAPGDPSGGPCYRCLFPRPPPAAALLSCGEGGILGPVVGAMGVLQALEALRVLLGDGDSGRGNGAAEGPWPAPSLLLLSAAPPGPPAFRAVRMRGRRAGCFACGAAGGDDHDDAGTRLLSLDALAAGSVDYVAFCGGGAAAVPVEARLAAAERVSAAEYRARTAGAVGTAADGAHAHAHLLLDVREKAHFDVCSIEGAVNVPFSRIQGSTPRQQRQQHQGEQEEQEEQEEPDWMPAGLPHNAPIYVVCRVGNDSQLAARRLKELGLDRGGERFVGDIVGGMRAWRDEVDGTMPFT